jgi:hypothetical protein
MQHITSREVQNTPVLIFLKKIAQVLVHNAKYSFWPNLRSTSLISNIFKRGEYLRKLSSNLR